MELWQMDVVGGILLADGSELKALTGVDDHSRVCVVAGLMPRATSRAVCGHFTAALRRFGVPQEILTDNGPHGRGPIPWLRDLRGAHRSQDTTIVHKRPA
jgi:transposase InsO family protein